MTTTGPAALDARPSRRRVALAAVPWLLAACLAGAGLHWRTTRPAADAAPDPPPAAAADDGRTSRGADAAPTATTSRPDPTVSTPLPPAAALAVVAAARTALGTAGVGESTGPHPDRWALDVRVVATERVTESVAVVTVHGLVIDRVDGGWSEPVVRAIAVPVATGGTPGVLGPGWPLPDPSAANVALDTRHVADPAPSVVEPLLDAGWDIEEVTAVDLVAGALLRVRLQGTAPGDSAAAGHEVWLHDAPGGPLLLPAASPSTTANPAAVPDRPTDRTSTEEST